MLQIAIIGCGPAGLSAAIFLHDQGHAVTLYEQFDEARAVGSGLMLQPTGLEVLQRLGLRAEAEQLGQRVDGMLGRVAPNGKVVLDVQYDVLAGNHYGVAIHRAALFHVLYQAVLKRSITVLTNRHIDTLVTSESGVQFSDERSPAENVMYDFVIDASGRQSKLIKFAEKTPRRRELHYGALWGTVKYNSSAFNDRVLEQRYQQAKVMVGVLPCGRLPNSEERVATFFWSLRNDAYQRTVDAGIGAWKREVASHWPVTESLLAQFDSFDQLAHAVYSHHTLPLPYGNRVVFIGDAAHSTSPQLGQGANMALLDAYALGRALQNTSTPEDAFSQYAKVRRLHVRLFQAASLTLTPFYQSDNRAMPWLRDILFEPVSKLPLADKLVASLGAGLMSDPVARIEAMKTDKH